MNLGSVVLLLHARGELVHCDLELCYKRRLADSGQSRLRPDPQARREGSTVDRLWGPGCNAFRKAPAVERDVWMAERPPDSLARL